MSTEFRKKRSLWTYNQEEEPVGDNLKESFTWYKPSSKETFVYNGEDWIPFIISDRTGKNGYIVAGGTTSIDKIIFSNDETSTITSTLTNTSNFPCGFSSKNSGYCCGKGEIHKLSFATENTSSSSSSTISLFQDLASNISSITIGYICGAYNSPFALYINDIYKFAFSTETISDSGNNINSDRKEACGFSSKENNSGYLLGGLNGSGYLNSIEKISFTNDTSSVITSDIVTQTKNASSSSSLDRGFVFGGTNGSSLSVIQILIFATDLTSSSATTLTEVIDSASSVGGLKGGYISSGNRTTTNEVDKFNYKTDISETLTSTISSGRSQGTGLSWI